METQLSLVLGIFLSLLSNALSHSCHPAPTFLADAHTKCAEALSAEDKVKIFGRLPAEPQFKTYALCYYTTIGYFKNGKFSLDDIANILESSIPDQSLGFEVYELDKSFLEMANYASSPEEKAYSFYKQTESEEMADLVKKIYCYEGFDIRL